MIEPTERSIPPETMTIVMPIATIVMTAVWRAIAARLLVLRKTGFLSSRKYSETGINTHKAIRLMKGRNRFIQSGILCARYFRCLLGFFPRRDDFSHTVNARCALRLRTQLKS